MFSTKRWSWQSATSTTVKQCLIAMIQRMWNVTWTHCTFLTVPPAAPTALMGGGARLNRCYLAAVCKCEPTALPQQESDLGIWSHSLAVPTNGGILLGCSTSEATQHLPHLFYCHCSTHYTDSQRPLQFHLTSARGLRMLQLHTSKISSEGRMWDNHRSAVCPWTGIEKQALTSTTCLHNKRLLL